MISNATMGLDVGERRIGVALAPAGVRIAAPYGTVEVNGQEVEALSQLMNLEKVMTLVIGYPRNQAGEPTAQTIFVEQFTQRLKHICSHIVFQDESLTSVVAEQRLQSRGGAYVKGDIDAEAATIILQDYLELQP